MGGQDGDMVKRSNDSTLPAPGGGESATQELLRVVASGEKEHDLFIYGQIGRSWFEDGVTAQSVSKALADIPKSHKVNLRINSPGGSVSDGLAIYNLLADRRKNLTTYIDGYALSAASFIGLAASRVVIPESGIVMIHNPHSYAHGDANELRRNAEILDTHRDAILNIYAKRVSKPRSEIIADMDSELWLSGSEAVEYGLATELSDAEPVSNMLPEEYRDALSDRLERFVGWQFGVPDFADYLERQVGAGAPAVPAAAANFEVEKPKGEANMVDPEIQARLDAKDQQIAALSGAVDEYKSALAAALGEVQQIKARQEVGEKYAALRRQAEQLLASAKLSRNEFDKWFTGEPDADVTALLDSGRAAIRLEVIGDYLEAVSERSAVLLPTEPKVKEPVPDRKEPAEPETPTGESAEEYARSLIANLGPVGV